MVPFVKGESEDNDVIGRESYDDDDDINFDLEDQRFMFSYEKSENHENDNIGKNYICDLENQRFMFPCEKDFKATRRIFS